jgi:hypothetical protein
VALYEQRSGLNMKIRFGAMFGVAALITSLAASAAVIVHLATPATTKGPRATVDAPSRQQPVTSPARIDLSLATSAPPAVQGFEPAATTVPVSVAKITVLPPLMLSDMALWHWSGKWMASEWENASGPIPWRYDHIAQVRQADTVFTLDADGAPQLQALNGTTAYDSGIWETDVTLPTLKDGVIVAPLWVYNAASSDEVDFEFAGRYGLDVSLHSKLDGVMQKSTVRLFPGVDMSGQRKRFGIKVDQRSGLVEMYVDGRLVHRWDRRGMAFFVSSPLKPWIEMWPTSPTNSGLVQWAGRWSGFAAGEKLAMTVHGYAYTPLAR